MSTLCFSLTGCRSMPQLKHSFKQIGIEARFFDVTKPEEIKKLAHCRTSTLR